jgi:hypothetical protein
MRDSASVDNRSVETHTTSEAVIKLQMNIVRGMISGQPLDVLLSRVLYAIHSRFQDGSSSIWWMQEQGNTLTPKQGMECVQLHLPDKLREYIQSYKHSWFHDPARNHPSSSITEDCLTYLRDGCLAAGLPLSFALPLVDYRTKREIGALLLSFPAVRSLTPIEETIIRQYALVIGYLMEKELLDRENHYLTYFDDLTKVTVNESRYGLI